ncbi:M14 family zinc carboxypeptidase [Pleomorphovibrio marinus]|uniref:M14 family zinc carboxypeptidase n=1 Tax=Pleomorphovibrio marinus TaxID=2164132 RepID=UPI001E564FBF|nr:M14 family zinc carboxypeptidase [Pleomorphovibrio marinus]
MRNLVFPFWVFSFFLTASLFPLAATTSQYPTIYSRYQDSQLMDRSESYKLLEYPTLEKGRLFFMEKDTLDHLDSIVPGLSTIELSAAIPAGNASFVEVSRDTVYFKPDLRDTEGHWFYWHFKASAQKQSTWYFKCMEPNTLTNKGAAFSKDGGRSWQWIPKEDHLGEDLFRFHFTVPGESVQLSMGMPYTESDLNAFLAGFQKNYFLRLETLTHTAKGRSVEKILLSDFSKSPKVKVLFTARAHACEMMSNYVMEGMIEALLGQSKTLKNLLKNAEIMMIPFVDKDGVEEGDQGKNRRPRDHNRDYAGESIYASTAAIREQVPEWVGDTPWIGVDLHNPWIKGENNEWIYLVGNANPNVEKAQKELVDILVKEIRGPLKFSREEGFLPFGTAWNTGTNYDQGASFAQWASQYEGKGLLLTTTLEFPYALNHGQVITAATARAFGSDLIHALASFLAPYIEK